VEDLLDMSRIHEGSVELTVSTVDVVEVVESAVSDAVAAAGVSHASVARTGLPVAMVATDPVLVRRVVYNLVLNALVHGGESEVTVDVGAVGGETSVRVVDHGSGVPVDARAEVFRPFQRRSDAGGSRGVGLGLAIARGFVDALGGDLNLEDTPGGGCTMVLVLPAGPTSEQLPGAEAVR
jgi:two-component system sensor histidine kinase KdpD